MKTEDLVNRFSYHRPDGEKARKHEDIRDLVFELAEQINVRCPDCRELSLSITALEEAMMWANAALARHTNDGERILS